MSMQITSPPNGTTLAAGIQFGATVEQQIQGGMTQGVATLRFGNSPDGPWATARPVGEGGPLECDPVQWSGQGASFELPTAQANEAVFAQVAVWPDGNFEGEPTYFSEDEVRWPVRTKEKASAPETRR